MRYAPPHPLPHAPASSLTPPPKVSHHIPLNTLRLFLHASIASLKAPSAARRCSGRTNTAPSRNTLSLESCRGVHRGGGWQIRRVEYVVLGCGVTQERQAEKVRATHYAWREESPSSLQACTHTEGTRGPEGWSLRAPAHREKSNRVCLHPDIDGAAAEFACGREQQK